MKTTTIGMILFFCTTLFWFKKSSDLKRELSIIRVSTKNKIDRLENDNRYLGDRLHDYFLIDLEQNEIIEKFKSSRDAKYSNKTLMELQTNLD